MTIILKTVLGLMTASFAYFYLTDAIGGKKTFSDKSWPGLLGAGFISNFFDTLGIGSFAQQTAMFKFFKLVDDRVIPMGTRLYIPGYGFAVAADRGSAIKGNRIDLCFNTYAEAKRWGRRKIKVYLLN